MELAEIGKNILTNCMNVKPGENVLIVTDDEKYAIGQALYQAAKLLKALLDSLHAQGIQGQPDFPRPHVHDVVVVRQSQPHPLRHRG